MKKRDILIIAMMMCALLVGCQKSQEVYKEPKVTEKEPEISSTQASFAWTVDYPGKISSVVELGRIGDLSDAVRYGSEAETDVKDFHVTVTGLEENTQYYYRYVVWNPNSHFDMGVKHFTTLTITLPVVATTSVTDVTTASAVCGGEVTDDGNHEVTERGICWSTSHQPEITDSHAGSGSGLGSFTASMTGLAEGTVYYVRAYAVNSKGVAYGQEVSFNTSITGGINGLYSVGPNEKVYFSKGNLQYQASTDTWRFAEHQYDCIGKPNENASSTYSGWIDLFGWGTSGWPSGAICYQPWSTSSDMDYYYPGGSCNNNLTGNCANADWGVYNPISNGGNQAGLWRTITKNELTYLFDGRETPSDMRFAKACVNNVNGLILLPDDWNRSYYNLNNVNEGGAGYGSNAISATEWSALEQHGAVFLPAAGYRSGTKVDHVGGSTYYWTSTACDQFDAYHLRVLDNEVNPHSSLFRDWGTPVRLVRSL